MDQNIEVNEQANKKIADEFSSWPMNEIQIQHVNKIRSEFDRLLDLISNVTPPQNGRYLSIVKTKLEEASMFAVKGIAKP